MSARSDRPAKIRRLVEFLAERNAAAIALTRAESLSWLFDGARVTVPYAGAPVCSAVVDSGGGIVVTAHANEADRLRSEELGTDVAVQAVPWHRPLPAHGAEVLREEDHLSALRRLRAPLLPLERERYTRFASELTRAVGDQLRDVSPAEREHDLAARLLHAVAALGAEPMVVLAAGQERAGVPHPLPTAARLGRRAMAVVGARRHGLVVNLTRWVSFGSPAGSAAEHTGELESRLRELESRLREVEADAFAATRPDRTLGAVLADIADSYRRHGFGAGAWLAHHQGGPTGYLGRDPKATPDATDLVQPGQAFAWNPWVPGAKSEDTAIFDREGPCVLTVDPAWPVTAVRGIPRPLTLERD